MLNCAASQPGSNAVIREPDDDGFVVLVLLVFVFVVIIVESCARERSGSDSRAPGGLIRGI
jgi:hypothetical protein